MKSTKDHWYNKVLTENQKMLLLQSMFNAELISKSKSSNKKSKNSKSNNIRRRRKLQGSEVSWGGEETDLDVNIFELNCIDPVQFGQEGGATWDLRFFNCSTWCVINEDGCIKPHPISGDIATEEERTIGGVKYPYDFTSLVADVASGPTNEEKAKIDACMWIKVADFVDINDYLPYTPMALYA